MIAMLELGLLLLGGKWYWRILKYKLRKGKGSNWLIKANPNGTVKIDFTTVRESVDFGKDDISKGLKKESVVVQQIFHHEEDMGIPLHVAISGLPTTVNLLAYGQATQSAMSPLVNQSVIRAHQLGIIEGMTNALKEFAGSKWMLILLIVVLAVSGFAAYQGYQNNELLKQLVKAGITVAQGAGGTITKG
jgi:hypothetical protein